MTFGDNWVLKALFPGKVDGYYIECGAWGAEHTAPLEAAGWHGLLVEPHPDAFARLTQLFHRKAATLNYCATDVEKEVEINLAGPITGIVGETHWKYEQPNIIKVQGKNLGTMLDEVYAPKTIEYLCLDVEGAEWLILKSFPFDRYSILSMTIEANNNVDLVDRFLIERDYICVARSEDHYWVHASIARNLLKPHWL